MAKPKKKTTKKRVDFRTKYAQMTALLVATLGAAVKANHLLRSLRFPTLPVNTIVEGMREIHKGVK